jgi:hypothetical protein
MVVCLSVKTATSETVFTLRPEGYLDPEPDLWIQSVKRVLSDPVIKHPTAIVRFEDSEYFVTAKEVRRLRDRVRLPSYFIEVERVVQQVSSGQWNDLQLPHDRFKQGVQHVWECCQEHLPLESQILDSLYANGNGGLRVESILSRLLAAGVLTRFAVVRDALGHLCKLCLVEHAYGQFSIRDGMLGDKAFKCLTV